jgi:hypothetical protein
MSANSENTGPSKYAISFGLSLAVASVVNGILVVAKEKSTAVMTGMAKLTGHHWVTHSAIILGLFAILGWLLAQSGGGQGIKLTVGRLIGILVSGVAIGALIILVFYLVGD